MNSKMTTNSQLSTIEPKKKKKLSKQEQNHRNEDHREGYQWERGRERILKAAREQERVTYEGVPIRLWADYSKETLQARWGWKVFQVMKGKDLHPRLVYPAKLSFRMEGQIKCFSDKVELKEFIITKPSLYEMLKGVL